MQGTVHHNGRHAACTLSEGQAGANVDMLNVLNLVWEAERVIVGYNLLMGSAGAQYNLSGTSNYQVGDWIAHRMQSKIDDLRAALDDLGGRSPEAETNPPVLDSSPSMLALDQPAGA